MAQLQCPKCQRANHENRWKCIYCGAALNPPGDKLPQIQKAKRQAGLHVNLVLLPAENAESYVLPKVGVAERQWLREVFSADDFHVDSWMKTRGLRVLRTLKEIEPAKELAAAMGALGFRAFAIPNEELNELGQAFHARAVDLQESWTFYSPKEGKLVFSPGTAVLLVKGKIKVERSGSDEKKGNVASLLKDGSSRDHSHHFGSDTHDYLIFDLYTSDPSLPPVRVKSSRFDFHCLGDETHGSSAVNFEKLILRLLGKSPELYIDEHFRFVPPLLRTSGAEMGEAQEQSAGGGLENFRNNENQFDQVARMICWLFRRSIRIRN